MLCSALMSQLPFSLYDTFAYLASGFVVLAAAAYGFDHPSVGASGIPAQQILLGIVIIYIAGHLIAHLSSLILESWLLRKVIGCPEDYLLCARDRNAWARLFPANFKPLPEPTRERIRKRANVEGVPVSGRALFYHCHAIVKHDEVTLDRLSSFLKLYGFCRNMCLALVASAILLLIGLARASASGPNAGTWAIMATGASVVMFYRYLKFYRHYALEVLTSYSEPKQTAK